MKVLKGRRPTPALIVAMVALVTAMSGAAVALPGKATVSTNDIKKQAITKKLIAKGAVGSQQIIGKSIKGNRIKDGGVKAKQIADATITNGKIADGTIQGAKVADETLSSKNISDYAVFSSDAGNFVKLTATDGADEAAARDAAPETTLFAKGQLTFSAKCFRDDGADVTFAEIYVATTADGAIFDGQNGELSGGPAASDFLNVATALIDRRVATVSAGATDAEMNEGEVTAASPDGTHLVGQVSYAAKTGDLGGGNGVYGAGNVCLFGGEISG